MTEQLLGHDTFGTGPTKVIIMNDWMADTSTWDVARRYLDGDSFTYVFTDLRGYGRSKELAGPFDLKQSVTDILGLIEHLGWEKFAIVGHSMSTLIALHIAQNYPEQVERAVVLTPAPPAGFNADEDMIAEFRKTAFFDNAERVAHLNERWGDRLSPGWSVFKAERWMATANPEAVADYIRMFAQVALPDPTVEITVPLLAITGEEDVDFMRSEPVTQMLGALAKDLTVVPFVQCSHYPMQEMPPLTVATVERFLRGE